MCFINFTVRQKFILGLIYFWTTDFKGLSTVATVLDHQNSETCWCWDSFWYPKLLQYEGIKSHVRKHVAKLCVKFSASSEKDSSYCPSIGFPYEPIYHAAAVVINLASDNIIHGYQTYPLVEFFPRTGASNISFAKCRVEEDFTKKTCLHWVSEKNLWIKYEMTFFKQELHPL